MLNKRTVSESRKGLSGALSFVDLPKKEGRGPVVFYHADCTDGYGAAFSAWLEFKEEAQYIPVQFGQIKGMKSLLELADISDRVVYILDFSFPVDITLELFEKAHQVIWLDHHKTSFDEWCGEGYLKPGRSSFEEFIETKSSTDPHHVLLDTERSGAGLAWDYFNSESGRPRLISYIEDYDLSRFALKDTKEFILGLHSMVGWSFPIWKDLNERLGSIADQESKAFLELVGNGKVCSRFQDKLIETAVSESMEINIPGESEVGMATTCSVLLANDVGIALLNRGAKFAACWYVQANGEVKCSLRSRGDFDVERLAVSLGGGGHPRSSAFRVSLGTFMKWIKQ